MSVLANKTNTSGVQPSAGSMALGKRSPKAEIKNGNIEGAHNERITEHKRVRNSDLDSHSAPNCNHKRSISLEETRPINSSTISKAKKTKVQQIRSH